MSLLARHNSGEFRELSQDTGRVLAEGETLSCAHCGKTWHVKPGSGTHRGWCFKCNAPTCGSRACQTCLPWERQMEIMEQRHRLWQEMECQRR